MILSIGAGVFFLIGAIYLVAKRGWSPLSMIYGGLWGAGMGFLAILGDSIEGLLEVIQDFLGWIQGLIP